MSTVLNPLPAGLLQTPIFDDLQKQIVSRPWAQFWEQTALNAGKAAAVTPATPPPGSATGVHVTYAGNQYLNSIDRILNDKAGERISVLDFGAIGDGNNDDSPAFQSAYDAAVAKGGCEIYVPGARPSYNLLEPINITGTAPVIFTGDGRASLIVRGAAMPAGKGLFDLQGAKNVKFRRIMVDGAITSPTGVNYSSISGDPLNSILTANTSFWLHDGCTFIEWEDVVISHTGGYAILANAATADITDLYFLRLHLENNRPHLFGTDNAHLEFGSWTGGVHFHGSGTASTAMVRRAHFQSCSAYRCTGNCFWQHVYGFSSLHEDIHMVDMYGEDIGLDFVLFGGVTNASLVGFACRRIGYTTVDDTTASVPKWINGPWGVAVDHSGVAISTVVSGGTIISANGGYIDADGMGQSSITNVVCRTPRLHDPEYTTDQIATVGWGGSTQANGPNFAYGLQTGNTGAALELTTFGAILGGDGNIFSGNKFTNISGGAIRLYASSNGHVEANNIDHPAAPTYPPMTIGNVGALVGQRSFSNVVKNNRIAWDPTSATPLASGGVPNSTGTAACIVEDSSLGAFNAADKNWVFDNPLINYTNKLSYEFKKDSVTASATALYFSSNFAALAAPSATVLQREGRGSDWTSALKFYALEGTTATQIGQYQNYRTPTVLDPLFNVSLAAGAQTGVITTGAITTNAMGNSMVTGQFLGTGFLALTDTTYLDANANLLDGTWALLKWDNSLTKWRQSVSVSAGARVWTDFTGGGGTVAGADTQIQYNGGGAFAADANFLWRYTPQQMKITGLLGAAPYPALVVTDANSPHTAYIQSDGGFNTSAPNSDAFSALNGGITALQLLSIRNDGDSGLILKRTSATAREWGIGIDAFGNFIMRDRTGTFNWLTVNPSDQITINNQLIVTGVALGQAILVNNGYIQSSEGFLSNATNFNVYDAPTGGMRAHVFTSDKFVNLAPLTADPTTASYGTVGEGSLYCNTATPGSHTLRVFLNGGWTNLSAAGTAGSDQQIQYNKSNNFGADANLTWDYTNKKFKTIGTIVADGTGVSWAFQTLNNSFNLDNSGNLSVIGVIAANGSGGSVNVPSSTNFNAIQAPSGGMFAHVFTADKFINLGTGTANPTTQTYGTIQEGSFYCNTTSHTLRAFLNGGWVDIGTSNPAGSDTYVQYNKAAAFGADANLTWNYTTRQLTVTAAASSYAAIAVGDGGANLAFIQSSGGFFTPSAATNAVNAPNGTIFGNNLTANNSNFQAIQAQNGGVYAASLRALNYLQTGQHSGIPPATLSDTLVNGAMYYDTSTNQLRALIASVWQNVLTTASGAGVLSLNSLSGALAIAGTVNQVNVASGGNTITLSLPQSIATFSAVTFGSVTASGAIQSTVGGASVAFQAGGGSFQVLGNGNFQGQVCSTNGYNAGGSTFCDISRNVTINSLTGPGGVTLINSLNQFVSTGGINCGRFAGISCRAFNPYDGAGVGPYTGQDYTIGFNGVKLTVNGGAVNTIKTVGGVVVSFA